jgi:hypothetical protein
MQLERCELNYKHSHVTATCRTFIGSFPDDDLPESPEDSSDEDAEDEEEEELDDDDEDEDEEEADDMDDDSGDCNNAIVLPSDGDGMYPNL